MLFKSLILGVMCCTGIFAVKGGIGAYYGLAHAKSRTAKIGALFIFWMAYLLLFAAVGTIVSYFDPIRHLDTIRTAAESGMVVHLTMAGVMAVWGIYLLVRPGRSHSASRAWLLMTVPCPVCFGVILISAAFGISLFPDRAQRIVPALYLSFMLISMVTMGISHWRHGDGRNPPEHLPGGVMVMLAAYFFISITVMPQIGDLDKIYRMASYHESTSANHSAAVAPTLLATAAAFAVGCGTTLIKIRRSR